MNGVVFMTSWFTFEIEQCFYNGTRFCVFVVHSSQFIHDIDGWYHDHEKFQCWEDFAQLYHRLLLVQCDVQFVSPKSMDL